MGTLFWLGVMILGIYLFYRISKCNPYGGDGLIVERKRIEKEQQRKQEIEDLMKKKKVKNIARPTRSSLEWFPVKEAQEQISHAESKIVVELNKFNVVWYREVAFKGLQFSEAGYARYDFLIVLPVGFNKHNIHIIEYDGKNYHHSKEQRQRDKIKDEFCIKNGIPLTRYNSKNYYHLDLEIGILMRRYGITLK